MAHEECAIDPTGQNMRTTPIVISLAVLAGSLGSPRALAQAQPQQPKITITDTDFPPATLEDLSSESSVVARVRIRAANVRKVGHSVVTAHDATILEVLKGESATTGQMLTIVVPVGRIEVAGQPSEVGEAAGMREFAPGQEVLVFLRKWPAAQGYSIAYGRVGYYVLDTDSVAVPVGARSWAPFAGRRTVPKSELLADMRARVK